jgi:uncharacterized Fe-S center protein
MADSIIYFTPTTNNEPINSVSSKLKTVFQQADFTSLIKKDDFVAVKLHMGEEKKKSSILPLYVRTVVDLIKKQTNRVFLTDSNVLYESPRDNAVEHLILAGKNGFSFEQIGCPIIIADGLVGESQTEVLSGYRRFYLAGLVKRVDVIIALSHCTGHLLTGYGGAIKNIGMGFASRGGKLDQHSGIKPEIVFDECKGCKTCITYCPAKAIEIKNKKSYIIEKECFGCGECLAICPHSAVKVDKWHSGSDELQKKMALYCGEILKDKKACFINFATSITKNCDCIDEREKPLVDDVGILSSFDPVAVDRASIDLINQKAGKDLFRTAWPEIDYTIQLKETERLGVGTERYRIHP